MARLDVATIQFPVTGDLAANARAIRALMRSAARRGARIAHFSETCLTGYAGVDLPSFRGYDWAAHRGEMERIAALAGELEIWTVVGSSHPLTPPHKPHNSVYVIDDRGRLVDRYDKRFCTRSDLRHYTPGSAYTVFDVDGVRCGVQICYDFRFQELYREHYKLGVKLMLHSYHQAHGSPVPPAENVLGHIVPATMAAYAANNHMWISANNSQAKVSRWSSFFVLPDGRIQARLPLHRAGMLISTVDTKAVYYDAPGPFRERAIRGQLTSLPPVKDPRSRRRTAL